MSFELYLRIYYFFKYPFGALIHSSKAAPDSLNLKVLFAAYILLGEVYQVVH